MNMGEATMRRNPYIIGRPISEPELFFGRESLFEFIEDNLKQGVKVILLHGQRRIGKSTVLCQIPKFVGQDEFVFVPFDLQDKSQLSLSEVLHRLSTEIIDNLDLHSDRITPPSVSELTTEPQSFSSNFLPQIYRALGMKKVVLLMDEFDVLSNYTPGSAVDDFFPFLQSIISRHEELFVIPVVGRRLDDMPKLVNLFRAPYREIGLLDESSAKRLITQPAKNVLKYEPDAIQAILNLSAGHPYFTQVLCFALFSRSRQEQRWQVTPADVEIVVDKAIELGEAGLVWFREGLPIPERVFFAAVAETQHKKGSNKSLIPDPALSGAIVEGQPRTVSNEFASILVDERASQEFYDILKGMLHSITIKVGDLLRADRASVYLLDKKKNELWSVVAEGEKEEIRIPIGRGIVGKVAKDQKSINNKYDFFDDPRSAEAKKLYYQKPGNYRYRTYTMLTLPLMNEHKTNLVAVVQLLNKLKKDLPPKKENSTDLAERIEKPGFTEEDEKRFEELAPLIRLIVESSRSFYEAIQIQRGVEELIDAILSVSQSCLNLETTLQLVMEKAKKLTNADRSAVWILDNDRNNLWTKIPQQDGSLEERRVKIGEGFVGKVATTRKLLNIPYDLYNHKDSETAKKQDQLNGYRTCSLLCMPVLNANEELIGVTQLVNKKKQGDYPPYDPADGDQAPECWQESFDDSDEKLMKAFNKEAAVVLQNAQLPIGVLAEEVYQQLEEFGVDIKPLREAEDRLFEGSFLTNLQHKSSSGSPSRNFYKVTIELVRRWLMKRHSLRREILELKNESISPEAYRLYQEANELNKQRNNNAKLKAIQLYGKVLNLNPNHFSAVYELAQAYLDNKNFEKAVEFYERAFKVDPTRNKEGLLEARLTYGKKLLLQGKFELAGNQFTQALNLNTDDKILQEVVNLLQPQNLEKNPTQIHSLLEYLSAIIEIKETQKYEIQEKIKKWRQKRLELKKAEAKDPIQYTDQLEHKGIRQGTCDSVIEILETRFKNVPQSLRENLNTINDIETLKRFLKQAIIVTSLEEFQQVML